MNFISLHSLTCGFQKAYNKGQFLYVRLYIILTTICYWLMGYWQKRKDTTNIYWERLVEVGSNSNSYQELPTFPGPDTVLGKHI